VSKVGELVMEKEEAGPPRPAFEACAEVDGLRQTGV